MTFDDLNLNSALLKALDDLGYRNPTPIQRNVFSVIMSGRDVCGIAQTGTGKTFAYLLPCLRQYRFSKDKLPQLLILVPTRELVIQVVAAVKSLSVYMPLEATGVYGGVNMKPQAAAVANGTDVVVATPGRLLDLVYSGALRLKSVKKLVIDEMDEMMRLGFRAQLNNILDLLPERRQNLVFSATMTEETERLIDNYFNNPERIEAASAGTPVERIRQSAYHVPNFHTKANLLELLLRRDPEMSRVLVFVATKQLADLLYERLSPGFPEKVGVIHSNKEQNHRFNTVERFRDGTYRVIIATDIIARGIDISEVTHVVNMDMPEVPEHYIHRIGRTGRADRDGIAISFVAEQELERQQAVERLMHLEIPVHPLPGDLEASELLLPDEQPKVKMKTYLTQLPKMDGGGAFHEKSAKNRKVNVKVSHADKMKQKYGKPRTRGAKKR